MPLDRAAEFVAVDEIQLCADPDRGHVFTDRLLHARGLVETMFLGAETIRPLLHRLVPRRADRDTAAAVAAAPRRAGQADATAAAHRRGRVPRRRGLRHRRADPPPPRRLRRGDGPAVAAHPQRPGGALSGQGGRFPGRHRRDRHGPQHGRRPRRLRRPRQVRRPPHRAACCPPRWRRSPAAPGAACATARSAPPPTARRWTTTLVERGGGAQLRAADAALLAQRRSRFHRHRSRCSPACSRRRPARASCAATTPPIWKRWRRWRASRRSAASRTAAPGVRRLWDACQIPDFRKLADETHTRLCARVFGHVVEGGTVPTDWLAGTDRPRWPAPTAISTR